MRVTLPDGTEAVVFVKHHRDTTNTPRRTTAEVAMPIRPGYPLRPILEEAVCSEKDQFVKQIGRILVAQRVVATLRQRGYDRDVRGAIFAAICPEFSK